MVQDETNMRVFLVLKLNALFAPQGECEPALKGGGTLWLIMQTDYHLLFQEYQIQAYSP